MKTAARLTLLTLLASACSTSAASPDAATCPGVHPMPAAIEFDCDASLPDAGGCPGAAIYYGQTFSDGHTYAPGCHAYLPAPLSACVGTCCGPEVCFCEARVSGPDSGPGFVCPY